VWGICDAELIQEMQDLCESHAAYTKGIVFGIGHGLGSRLLFCRCLVDRSSTGDDQSSCRFIVIGASSIVQINISTKCTFRFFSETQSPILHAVGVPKHSHESYRILIARVVIVPVENSDAICDNGPSGGHRVLNNSRAL